MLLKVIVVCVIINLYGKIRDNGGFSTAASLQGKFSHPGKSKYRDTTPIISCLKKIHCITIKSYTVFNKPDVAANVSARLKQKRKSSSLSTELPFTIFL